MVQSVDESFKHLSRVAMGQGTDVVDLVCNLRELLAYLKKIKYKHVKKVYDEKHLSSVCFDKKLYFKLRPLLDYCKAQLVVGIKYFESLIIEIEEKIKDKDSDFALSVIRLYQGQLYDFIFDFKITVEPLEKHLDPSYIFFSGGKSSATRSADLYRFSKAWRSQGASATVS